MSFVITIDGPAAAGKSTVARAVARHSGFLYVDTGALYRALGLKLVREGIAPDDLAAVERCLASTTLDLSGSPDETHVWLDGHDVSGEIRTPEVSELASRVAAMPFVRRRLVEIQRGLRSRGPLVGEGRDLGTVVFPDAEVKIFLDADLDTRAARRARELQARGLPVRLEQVHDELKARDMRDSGRPDSPLKAADDATHIDCSGMEIEAVVNAVLEVARAHPRWSETARPEAGRSAGPAPAGPVAGD